MNVRLDRPAVTAEVLAAVGREADGWGRTDSLAGRRYFVEYSCPNTNKPLHIGHLRNDALGESLSRILAAAGATVLKANLINDRGVHICKSMLAYQRFGGDATPESTGTKGDHFVGDWYVRYHKLSQEDPNAEEEVRAMLRRWEEGDAATRALWRRMNDWVLDGIGKTYRRTGISFDRTYYESELYTVGRDIVLDGIARGLFVREDDGSVQVDLSAEGLDKEVLLRSDGTSLYLTQDIGLAVHRAADWPFDRLIYVVASEQRRHFQVLFKVLGEARVRRRAQAAPPRLRHGPPARGQDEEPRGHGGRRGRPARRAGAHGRRRDQGQGAGRGRGRPGRRLARHRPRSPALLAARHVSRRRT